MGFVTAQGRGARGDGVDPGAHQGEGQSLLQTSRQLRPPASPEPLPGASEQGGAAGDLCGLASLWGQGLRWQTHVHTCPACKQVTHRHTGHTSVVIITVLLHVLLVQFSPTLLSPDCCSIYVFITLQRSSSSCWCPRVSVSLRHFLSSPELLALGWRQRPSAHTADGDPAHQGGCRVCEHPLEMMQN